MKRLCILIAAEHHVFDDVWDAAFSCARWARQLVQLGQIHAAAYWVRLAADCLALAVGELSP